MTTNQLQPEKLFGKIEESQFTTKAKAWKAELHWLEYAQQISLEVLEILDQRNITQKAFAELLAVSPQAVNKWLRGKENFTIETIAKIEKALGVRLLTIGNQPAEKQFVTSERILIKDAYDTGDLHLESTKDMRDAKVFQMSKTYASTAN